MSMAKQDRWGDLMPRLLSALVMAAIALQAVLGIMTVLYVAPWHLAILHQVLAVIVWVLILRARFLAHYPVTTSIREG